MFVIVETIENGERLVTALPKKWIVEDILYWPPVSKQVAKLCLKEVDAEINKWKRYSEFKVIQDNISSFDEARNREKFYSLYNNTDSEVEALNLRRAFKDHPVNFLHQNTNEDLNKAFEKCSKKITPVSNVLKNCNAKEENLKKPEDVNYSKADTNIKKDLKKSDTMPKIKNKISNNMTSCNMSVSEVELTNKRNVCNKKENLKKNFENIKKRETSELKSVEKKKMKLEEHAKNRNIIKNNEKSTKTKSEIDLVNNKLDKLQASVDVLSDVIQSFISDAHNEPKRKIKLDPLFLMPPLPFRSSESLKSFNKVLLDEEYVQQIGIRLARGLCSTMSLNKMVKLLLEKVATYDTLLLHTWSGKAGISVKAPTTKLAFNDYSGIISLIKISVNIVKKVTDNDLKKSIVEVLKRSTQNKVREEQKVLKNSNLFQPATSPSLRATEGTTEESDEEDHKIYANTSSSNYSSD